MDKKRDFGGRMFSIELASLEQLTLVSMPNERYAGLLIEGFLGELNRIDLIENGLLEIVGSKGIIRTDLTDDELMTLLGRENSARHERKNDDDILGNVKLKNDHETPTNNKTASIMLTLVELVKPSELPLSARVV